MLNKRMLVDADLTFFLALCDKPVKIIHLEHHLIFVQNENCYYY